MKEINTAPEFLTQNQFVEQVVETYRSDQNRFCFILGAGASVESGVPTGTELEMRWMNCLMGKKEDYPAPTKNPEETRQLAQKMFESGQVTHPFKKIEHAWDKAVTNGSSIPSEYYFDIYSLRFFPKKENGYWYLEKVMEGCRPSVGYHTLALLLTKNNKHNLVITTNFDSLVEDALFIYTEKKPMVAGHESLADYIDPNIQRPIVAKVHRSLFYEPINTPDNKLDPKWEEALQYFFASYTPIVIGYGGGDNSLMTFLEARTTKMRHGIYWCCRNGEDPGQKVKKLVADKGGNLVSIQGFDALMLAIGMELFKDEILVSSTADLFNKQSSSRMKEYNEQWRRWVTENRESNPEIVGAITKAEEEDQEKREKQNQLSFWDYFRRADNNYDLGRFEEAIEDYSKAIELDPDNPHAFNNRGCAYSGLGLYSEAIENLSIAIEMSPENAYSYNNRGCAYASLEDYPNAIADYNQAIKLNPDDADFHNNLGSTYDSLGLYDKALDEFNEAIKLNESHPEAYNNRGHTYLGLKNYPKAMDDLIKAIELNSNSASSHRHLGNTYFGMGDLKNALEELSLAISMKKDYIDAYKDRAKVYKADGQKALASADEAMAARLEAKQKKAK